MASYEYKKGPHHKDKMVSRQNSCTWKILYASQWRHNECDGISNHQPHDCLLNRLFRRRSKKTSKLLCVTGLCEGNSPVISEFPAQRALNVENVSIWWRYHGNRALGPDSIKRCHLTSIGNPIVEIRRSYDRLISTMGFPIPVRRHLYIESGPWWWQQQCSTFFT